MIPFARLLEGLVFTASRNAKLRLIADYVERTPDPDRGWAIAALTSTLELSSAKPVMVRALVAERVDPQLFAWSYDYVGDLAETVALIWPDRPGANRGPTLDEVVTGLSMVGRSEAPRLVERWLDALDAGGRLALLKLVTGGLRVGVSARLAKTALAEWGGRPVDEIEEVWHGLDPPFEELFAWLAGRAGRPRIDERATFRPLMLANPLNEADLGTLDPSQYRAEWKWDGIRVQLAARGGHRRIFSRNGDEIGQAFPEIVEAMRFDAVVDGELLVARPSLDGSVEIAPFNELQQRLNRKLVTARLLERYPAFVRLYDMLVEGEVDLRPLAFDERRRRLEVWHDALRPGRMDLSPLVAFDSWEALSAHRDGAREQGIEGLMLKRADSPYVAGRPKGPWFKWKRGALTLDVVLMYAQRGHGKRSSYYSDYTFGAWTGESATPRLVPVGKAYSGFTDEELVMLDRWVRARTVNRYGPVREVEPGLVLEVAFDSVHRSARHKSGVAMRFPRIHRIRWDKPAVEADRLETLEAMIVK